MKKPTLEQVKEYFKNAKVVECLNSSKKFNITQNIKRPIHTFGIEYWIDLKSNQVNLWDSVEGYAKIISYKQPSTNFISLDSPKKQVKKTVFEKYLNGGLEHLKKSTPNPSKYKNVLHIGYSVNYGDAFKCWNDDVINFTLTFGTKGDEFENN